MSRIVPDVTTTTTTTIRNGDAESSSSATVRERREALGLTRAQLAQLADVSYAQLGNIEKGCIPRRGYTVPRILEALNTQETKTP